MKLGIGIDTGGTCTDAVIYDFETKTILGTAKALTTRQDLTVGILRALDKLPGDLVRQAELVSLSTTLATNACVENRTGRCKLLFFGGVAQVIDQHGPKYGLPPSDEMLLVPCRTDFDGAVEEEPDWDAFRQTVRRGFPGVDGVGIVERNAMKNGAVVEKKAREIFQEESSLPVICGHELSSQLNCLQRGAGALLNAGLFSVIEPFLAAIRAAMEQRGISARVVIVRSDGSLMSEEFARLHPVETLLCGPAASALGGCALSDESRCVVVDMGGTTTDIALVEQGRPLLVEDGIQVGRWRPCVDGLYIKTFGLGGDTAIHWYEGRLVLEEYRVLPLCVLASLHPEILPSLRALAEGKTVHTRPLHEYLLRMRDISGLPGYTEEEQQLCNALADGPLSWKAAAEAVGKDLYTLKTDRLVEEGVLQVCGLTPTDLMHIRGEFTLYSAEAALLGAKFAARNLDCTVEELCSQVYDQVQRRLYCGIVRALLEQKSPHYRQAGGTLELERFLEESYDLADNEEEEHYLSIRWHTDFALLGIGGPARVFLPEVARRLGARAVLPEHGDVANALGAIVGSVDASATVEVLPIPLSEGPGHYQVFSHGRAEVFEELEEAEDFARQAAQEAAEAEARRRGVSGELTVTCTLHRHEAPSAGPMIYLGTRAVAHASGSPGGANR